MALQFQTLQFPFSSGLNQKSDKRASNPPALDVARDIRFHETQGVQTALPYAALGISILGGGTISNPRKLVANGDELLLFTDTKLYSWLVELQKWASKGTHLAVAVDEQERFTTTGDQITPDRAELLGTILYTWTDGGGGYIAAVDKVTGSVRLAPTTAGATRLRVIALSTKFLLFGASGTTLNVYALDPADPAAGLASPSPISATSFNSYFDVVKVDGQDLCVGAHRRAITTSYTVFAVDSSLNITTSAKARTCDGPIAVATIPGGTKTQIVRGHGSNVEGDLITTSSLADAITGESIGTTTGTPIAQITACFRSTQDSGHYRCYAFWNRADSVYGIPLAGLKYNWVDDAGTTGTAALFGTSVYDEQHSCASRAFEHGGHVYVWTVFAGLSDTTDGASRIRLYNTYFLWRDDALLVAKSMAGTAGGSAPSVGHLPGVALVDGTTGFAWCGNERRVVPLGDGSSGGYSARTPKDVLFTFDSDDARRCARLGLTLYVGGGLIKQYDGQQLVDLGWQIPPWYIAVYKTTGGPGSVADGTYAYKVTWRWNNARGERDRSSTAVVAEKVMSSGPGFFSPTWIVLAGTLKHITGNLPASEVWRTAKDPNADSPFYLASSSDPSATTPPNSYVTCDGFTIDDYLADADLTVRESNPENDGFLENVGPPAASIIINFDTRLFLAGVAGSPNRVWYSKQRADGEVAGFNDALVIDLPATGGDITAIAFLSETLVVFREHSIVMLPGSGFDNTGGGQNYGPAHVVSTDVGAVSMDAVALTPTGLVFKSAKGWYVLEQNWQVQYIGAQVSDFDSDTVHAMHVLESEHEVRVVTDQRMIVWDYLVGHWMERTISDGVDATIWDGTYCYLAAAAGPMIEQTTYVNLTYGLDVETAWIKFNDLQGYARVCYLMAFGEYRSDHLLRARIAYDYESDGAGGWLYTDDTPWIVSPTTVGGPEQVRISPTRQQCQAIKVRLTAVAELLRAFLPISANTDPITTSGTTWTAFLAAAAAYPGESGNALTFSCAFDSIVSPATFAIDIRDHLLYDQTLGRWREAINNVGIRVTCRTGSSPTVAQMEAAIVAGSTLCTLLTPDAAPSKVIDAAGMAGTTASGSFGFGTYTHPTGEALKLTGLSLEIGQRPGLYRQLPAAQKA